MLSDKAWRKVGEVRVSARAWPPSREGGGRRRLLLVTALSWASRSRRGRSCCSATFTTRPLTIPSSNTASPSPSQTSTLVSSDALIISLNLETTGLVLIQLNLWFKQQWYNIKGWKVEYAWEQSCHLDFVKSFHYYWDVSGAAGDLERDLETAPVLVPTPHVVAKRRSQQKLPRHIQRLKTQAERRNHKSDFDRSLPTLNRDLETYKSSERVQPPGPESFSESSETESQQDCNGMDFVGFKKTRDFGDFVTFSNSPSQVWFLWIDWLLTASLILTWVCFIIKNSYFSIKENSPLLEATPNRVKLVDNSVIFTRDSTYSLSNNV